MPTRITQTESPRKKTSELKDIGGNAHQPDRSHPESVTSCAGTERTVFKVEGTLHLKDAELLERICRDVGNQTKGPVTLELGGLSYLDSDSAAVLCRMKREQKVRLEGLRLFIERVIELTEESEKATKSLPNSNRPSEVS